MKKLVLLILLFSTFIANAQWVSQPSGTVDFLTSVFFPNTTVGYISANGYLLKTTNGGSNWNPLPMASIGGPLFFTSIDTGYTNSSSAGVLKTVDGGLTWIDNFPFATTDICNINFPTKSIGYVVTQNATFDSVITYKTVNEGVSWTLISSFETLLGILSNVYFSDAMTGSMVLQSSGIYKTSDGGVTWTPKLTTLSSDNLNALHFPSASVGYAVGGDSIFKTTDMGETWNSIYLPSSFPYNSVYFTDIDTGYACGGDGFTTGVIRKTVDGGLSWTLSNSNPYTFQSIHFPNSSTGYACGQSGTIYKYSTAVGVNDNDEIKAVVAYPNPNNGNLKLSIDRLSSNLTYKISVLDVLGNTIQKTETDELLLDIKICGQSKGIYFVKIENENIVVMKKIIYQ